MNENKIILALLQHSETNPSKKKVSVFMSYSECKGELEKSGGVLVLVVVEENEQHKEPPTIIKWRSFKMLHWKRFHMAFHL